MKHKTLTIAILILIFCVPLAFRPAYCGNHDQQAIRTAQEGHEQAPETGEAPSAGKSEASLQMRGRLLIVSAFSAAVAIGVAAFGAALAQGNALARALDSIGRNPESQSKIFPTLVLGLAFIESLALYALLIALALVFFNPLISKL